AEREARPDGLRERQRVGRDALALEREPLARAAGSGLHLVDDEQRVVGRRELAGTAEEALGQLDDAGLALDRLDEDRGDVAARERLFERRDRASNRLRARHERRERILVRRLG